MRAALLVMLTLPALLLGPTLAAQGVGQAVSTRVSFTIPERASSASANRVHSRDAGDRSVPVSSAASPSANGHFVSNPCAATFEIAEVGVFSVSCLETAPSGQRSSGVSIELVAHSDLELADGEWTTLGLVLGDGATIRLHTRELGSSGRGPRARAVVRGVRATLPAAAFDRIAASPTLTLVAAGERHVLAASDVRTLRELALALPLSR